jgi:hypothetical protein
MYYTGVPFIDEQGCRFQIIFRMIDTAAVSLAIVEDGLRAFLPAERASRCIVDGIPTIRKDPPLCVRERSPLRLPEWDLDVWLIEY